MWIVDPLIYTREEGNKAYLRENIISFPNQFPPIVSIEWGDGSIETPRVNAVQRGYWQNVALSHTYNDSG